MDSSDRVEMCLQHADIQDNLLQNYRNFLITLESVLLAVGIVLVSGVLSADGIRVLMPLSALILLGVFSTWIITNGQNIVKARGEDVTYWHKRAIEQEQQLSHNDRLFTAFKLHQKQSRRHQDPVVDNWFDKFENEEALTGQEVEEVVEHGLSHTRQTLDRTIPRALLFAWIVIIGISLIFVVFELVI